MPEITSATEKNPAKNKTESVAIGAAIVGGSAVSAAGIMATGTSATGAISAAGGIGTAPVWAVPVAIGEHDASRGVNRA